MTNIRRDRGETLQSKSASQGPWAILHGSVLDWENVAAGRYPSQGTRPHDRWSAAFARVSSDEQVTNGHSLRHQLVLALETAKRNADLITMIYLDPGLSGSRLPLAKRPGISALLADIRRGKVKTVYLYKRDRVTRQPLEWLQVLKACAKHDVRVVFTAPGEPPIGEGAYGQFLESVLIAAAQLEADVTGMRIRDSHLSRVQKGQPFGRLPFGYRRTEARRIVIDPEEAPIVEAIFRLAVEERLGLLRLARRINAEYPKTRRGREWKMDSILATLRNRTYCGYAHIITGKRDGKRGQYHEYPSRDIPAIVPEEVWLEAQQVRAQRKPQPRETRKYGARVRLVTGLAVCGVCGRALYTRATQSSYRNKDGELVRYSYVVYRCTPGERGEGCSNSSQPSTRKVDYTVIQALDGLLVGLDLVALHEQSVQVRSQQQAELDVQRALLRAEGAANARELEENQIRLETVDGTEALELQFEIRRLIEERTRLRDQQLALQERLAVEAMPSVDELALQAAQEWPADFTSLPLERQRELLAGIVERVIVSGETETLDIVFKFLLVTAGDDADRSLRDVPIVSPPPEVAQHR